jgi:nucleoside-diphosphate-sugar epimerase
MNDAIRATIEIMESPAEKIKIRSSYNVAGLSFNPQELAQEITKHFPNFQMSYNSDYRQEIANSWPKSIDDSFANKDWSWSSEFNLNKMTADMIKNLKK